MASPGMVPRYRRSLAGPIVLIVIGVLFLLRNIGVQIPLFRIFAKGWPLLLILWGVIKLFEHYQAKRDGGPPARIGAGGIVLLVFIIMIGLGLSTADRFKDQVNWGEVRDEMQMDDDFMRAFGSSFNYDQQVEQAFPDKGSVKVVSDKGNISIAVWDQKSIKVVAHKKVFAKDQNAANERNQGTQPQITVTGTSVLVNANTQASGGGGVQSDLEIYLPREAAVDVATRRGDVMISSRTGDVKVSTKKGDVTLDDIKGESVLSMDGGSVRARKLVGNLSVQGRIDDIDVADVDGSVRLNGDFFGSMRLASITKSVVFQSSRTDLELARLDGDLNIESDDLRANNILGPIRLTTRSKEIHLEDVSGDLRVENSNGGVEVHTSDAKPVGNIEINSRRGDVRLVLPSKAGFQMQATTQRGDVQSDFQELQTRNEHGQSILSGTVGKGTGRVQITNDNGDINIVKTT